MWQGGTARMAPGTEPISVLSEFRLALLAQMVWDQGKDCCVYIMQKSCVFYKCEVRWIMACAAPTQTCVSILNMKNGFGNPVDISVSEQTSMAQRKVKSPVAITHLHIYVNTHTHTHKAILYILWPIAPNRSMFHFLKKQILKPSGHHHIYGKGFL